jgi:hypothetical protein
VRLSFATCLVSAALIVGACGQAGTHAKGLCGRPPARLVALTDLKGGLYHGFHGGLYPDGRNSPPARYLAQGRALARQVQPLDPAGRPSPNGRIVLLSIGMSNAAQEFGAFDRVARAQLHVNPQLTIVDGAQGGEDARLAANPLSPFWSVVDQRLLAAGVSPRQVQAVWLKEAIAEPTGPFPDDARRLESDLGTIVRILRQRYPSLRLVYLSSRTYGGYAKTPLNPEPYAYDSGFAVKWLIEQRMGGRLRPWLGWGPYLWTDGTKGRRDGFVWSCDDVVADGTHPSANGRLKVADLLLHFFSTDPTARSWFLG